MAYNIGAYLGVAKEATEGTAVAPTDFITLEEPADIVSQTPQVDVANIGAFGPLATVPGIRMAEGGGNAIVSPDPVGFLFVGLVGDPSTTGSAPNYTHVWEPGTTFKGLTLEGQDGSGIWRINGFQIGQLQFEHTPQGYLRCVFSGMGRDKVSQGSAATPVDATQFFYQSHLTLTLDGVNISAITENVSVTLGQPKEALEGFGSPTISGVASNGEASANAEITIRADANTASRFTKYKASTPVALTALWSINANTQLQLELANAVFVADPSAISNKALGLARVSLQLRALSQGGALWAATLKNQRASY